MIDLIIWIIALVAIVYLLFVNMLLRDQNGILKKANKILHDANDEVLRNMIKFSEEMRLVKIQLDNLCRKV